MARGKSSANAHFDANDFLLFNDAKLNKIRESSPSESSPPTFSSTPSDCCLSEFTELSLECVIAAVRRLPNKHSAQDPLPTTLLKDHIDLLGPYITHIFNLSLRTGTFPTTWKTARVTLVLKKGRRKPQDVSSYRPISNLCVLSKLLERIVSATLSDHPSLNNLLPALQSAYRASHSTETAMLKVSSSILSALDRGKLALLSILDLTSTFDTVDRTILKRRLETSFGLRSTVLK